MFLYGKFENVVAEAYNQFVRSSVKPECNWRPRHSVSGSCSQKTVILAAIGLIHAAMPAGLFAQGGGRTELRPVRIATPPRLDGILDDEAWSSAPLQLHSWMSYNPMRGEATSKAERPAKTSQWPEMAPCKWVFESNAVLLFDDLRFFKASYLARF